MTETKSRRRTASRLRILLLAGAVASIGAMAVPGAASAAQCGGTVAVSQKQDIEDVEVLDYAIRCNEQIRGYSILTSRQIDYFSTEAPAFEENLDPTDEQAACEGPFPSDGFGCRGVINNGRIVVGQFAPIRDPCQVSNIADRFRVWVVGFTQEIDSLDRTILVAGHPTPLRKKLDCASPSSREVAVAGLASPFSFI